MDGGFVPEAAERASRVRTRPGPAAPCARDGVRLSRGGRLLAVATATAILASGMNALAQLAYLLARVWLFR